MTKRKWNAYSILNHEGGLWTDEVFRTRLAAHEYLSEKSDEHGWNLVGHTIVEVVVTMKVK